MDQATYHSPSQVTQMTGIEAHTLRVWERRYNFMVVNRKSSGARIYSDEEVKQLLKVKILLSSGYRISKIVKMSQDEMFSETQKVFATLDPDDDVFVQALMESALDFHEDLFNRVFDTLLEAKGLFNAFTNVVYPFLRRLGGLWINNKIIPVNEHFISNLIRQKLISAIDQLKVNPDESKKVMLFLPESEEHEIALLLAYYVFKKAGWRVIYLGLRVPLADLYLPMQKMKCKFGFTFIQLPRPEHSDQLLELVEKNPEFTLFLSGTATLMEDLSSHKQFSYLASPEELKEVISKSK